MPKKHRKPEQLQVGDTVNLTDLPPGSIVADVKYIYFLVDALANLRKELNEKDKTLRKAFEVARLTEDQIRITLEQLNGYHDGTISLYDGSATLFHVVEPIPLEIILNEVILSLGFNHFTPDSRGKLGLKLCSVVTTEEVPHETKLRCLETFGQNTISRMIGNT